MSELKEHLILELISRALEQRQEAYAPYSHFTVGAALLSVDGRIFTGCNVENAAFSPSVCAERVAFCKAVSEGAREFSAIAIAGGTEGAIVSATPPCGVCRQVMAEFCDPESFSVILPSGGDAYEMRCLGAMLPDGFGPMHMRAGVHGR